MPALLLASASPRRTQLLAAARVEHTLTPVGVDESWHPGESPVYYACRVSRAKAEAALGRPGSIILAADTVVWVSPKEAPLGKPADRDAARAMLVRLTDPDGPHFVTTACTLIDARGDVPRFDIFKETTRVWMRRVSPDELEAFLDRDEWRDKAGGYGIQDSAASFVTRIEGSYTNVVGLPVAQLLERLAVLEQSEGSP